MASEQTEARAQILATKQGQLQAEAALGVGREEDPEVSLVQIPPGTLYVLEELQSEFQVWSLGDQTACHVPLVPPAGRTVC